MGTFVNTQLNPIPGVCEQISDQQVAKADQNPAHVTTQLAVVAAGIQQHKHGAVAGPGSFIAHLVFHGPQTAPPHVAEKLAPVKRSHHKAK